MSIGFVLLSKTNFQNKDYNFEHVLTYPIIADTSLDDSVVVCNVVKQGTLVKPKIQHVAGAIGVRGAEIGAVNS